MRKAVLPCLLLFLCLHTAIGQHPFFKEHPLPDQFQDRVIHQLFQCTNGYLWLGTNKGLLRHDGIETVDMHVEYELDAISVSAIYQDQRGRLWVGYQNGLIYNHHLGKYQLWQPEEGLPKVAVTGFAENAQGQFWFSTYGEGIYCLFDQRMYNFDDDDGLPANDIYALETAADGSVWAGTDGGIAICRMDPSTMKLIDVLDSRHGLADNIVRDLIPLPNGDCWVGLYDRGVCFWDQSAERFEHLTPDWTYGSVNALAHFPDVEVWIGTENDGLFRIDTQQEMSRLSGPSARHSKVYDLLTDAEGNIWVANNSSSLYSANRQFEFIRTDQSGIQCVRADRSDSLWIGTQNGIFQLYPDSLRRQYHSKAITEAEGVNFVCFFKDPYENLWAGSFDRGVLIYNPHSGKKRWIRQRDGLTNNSILSIDGSAGPDGYRLWLATLGGVNRIDFKQNPLEQKTLSVGDLTTEEGLGTNFIYKVFVAADGKVWFGTDGKGLSVFQDGSITNFRDITTYEKDSFHLKTVYSLAGDTEGHLWFSTPTQGVFEFDGQHFRHISERQGIRNLKISSLASDGSGNILVTHNSGIDIIDASSHQVSSYGKETGMVDFEPGLNAFGADRLGKLYFASRQNLVIYTPLPDSPRRHPLTRLTRVTVSSEAVDYFQEHQFKHDQNNFVFDYIGIWLTEPEVIKYRYRVKNYHEDWMETADQRIFISNLPPGDYDFELMSTENGAFDDEPVSSYAFSIQKPYWLQWWFILLVISLSSALFLYLIRIRERHLAWKTNLQKENIASQLEVLKSQINPHFLFNSFNTLVGTIEEDPEAAVEYVEKLADFYRSIMLYRDKDIIALSEEIELVNNYTYLLQKRFGNNFKINVAVRQEKGYIAPLTLQMLIENAVKHNVISRNKPLMIDITSERNSFITVRNNIQKRIQPAKSTGFGLQSLTTRYEMLINRKMLIEETNTHFTVDVPLIE